MDPILRPSPRQSARAESPKTSGIETARRFADQMLSDYQHFRHLLISLSSDEMTELRAYLDRLRGTTLDARQESFQEVFPLGIVGQGEYVVQVRLDMRRTANPAQVYREFLQSHHYRFVVSLPLKRLEELNRLLESFMKPEEAADFSTLQWPSSTLVSATPKPDAYAAWVIQSLEPLPALPSFGP